MTETLMGGCLCGAIRYHLDGAPLAFYACHCTDCQRHTGSAFGLSMLVRESDLELATGQPSRFDLLRPDGRRKRGFFCGDCATRIWGEPASAPAIRVLRPGTLDRLDVHSPWGDIWTASARPWVKFTGGPTYPGQPADPVDLVRAWQARPSS